MQFFGTVAIEGSILYEFIHIYCGDFFDKHNRIPRWKFSCIFSELPVLKNDIHLSKVHTQIYVWHIISQMTANA